MRQLHKFWNGARNSDGSIGGRTNGVTGGRVDGSIGGRRGLIGGGRLTFWRPLYGP